MLGQGASPDAAIQALNLHQAMNPRSKPIISKPGDIARDENGQELWRNPSEPKEQTPSGLAKLIAERDKYPPGHPMRAIYDQAIKKDATHAPAASQTISLGGPTAVQMPDGTLGFMQPANRPGAPAQLLRDPKTGEPLRPPPQNRDTKLPAELQRMQIAGDAMETLMGEYEGLLKKHNPRDPLTAANPTVRANMQSIKRNIELQFKELQALGALAGPDIEIMRQALSDPFTMQGAFFGREGLLAQVRQARNLVKIRKDAVLNSQGQKPQVPASPAAPASAPDDPLGLRGN
jgi:hypothetical protein